MSKLKAYTLGNNGFVGPEVIEALGQPRHVRQASVLVIAATKKAAAELASERVAHISARDPELEQDPGSNLFVALEKAGLTGEPAIFCTPLDQIGTEWPLLRIVERRKPERVGMLRRGSGWELEFVPDEEA